MTHTENWELVLLELLYNWIKTWNKPNQCPKIQRKKICQSLTTKTTRKSPKTSAKNAQPQPQSHEPVHFAAISIPLWELAQRSVYCSTTACIFTHLFTNHIKSPSTQHAQLGINEPRTHRQQTSIAQLNSCVWLNLRTCKQRAHQSLELFHRFISIPFIYAVSHRLLLCCLQIIEYVQLVFEYVVDDFSLRVKFRDGRIRFAKFLISMSILCLFWKHLFIGPKRMNKKAINFKRLNYNFILEFHSHYLKFRGETWKFSIFSLLAMRFPEK